MPAHPVLPGQTPNIKAMSVRPLYWLVHTPPPPCNVSAHRIHTPLSVPRMRKLLLNHPNRSLVHFVMSGLLHGFDIGFRGSRDGNIVGANLSSAAMHPDFVSTYLAKCCKLNELLGPFTSNPFPFSSCSGVGCVP